MFRMIIEATFDLEEQAQRAMADAEDAIGKNDGELDQSGIINEECYDD